MDPCVGQNNNLSAFHFSLQALDLSWGTELLPSYKVDSSDVGMLTLMNSTSPPTDIPDQGTCLKVE